ncbi:MAG: chorismate mutase [Paludibacter sp.]|nr:chorismate mutase [Paludibacter sp.]
MHSEILIPPENCNNKEEVRSQIDKIDKEIIRMFAKRFEYVNAIVKFKKDTESIIAQERKDEVILKRGLWAEEFGLDKKTFETIYNCLIDSNIQKELEMMEKGSSSHSEHTT